MTFERAFDLMKYVGLKMKLPSWGGYWTWDEDKETILMHCKEADSETGKSVLDIRETQRVEYTLENILSDQWEEATEENCTLLGGTPTFDFNTAIKYLNRGMKLKRLGKNNVFWEDTENAYVYLDGNAIIYKSGTDSELFQYVITMQDILSVDWTFA